MSEILRLLLLVQLRRKWVVILQWEFCAPKEPVKSDKIRQILSAKHNAKVIGRHGILLLLKRVDSKKDFSSSLLE